jgi:hypothetical protein
MIYVGGGISCSGGTPATITLTVELYNVESPVPVDRTVILRIGGRTASAVAGYRCHTGNWYGKVKATVVWSASRTVNYGPLVGSPEPINCVA